MFSLDEIKKIRKQYILRDFKTLEARKKDGTIILPENLSEEERRKVISAIYLYRKINDAKINPIQAEKTDEELLDEIQGGFPQIAFSSEPKSISGLVLMGGRLIDVTICDLAKPEGDMNYMAETYLQYTLAEKGKMATNIQRGIYGGMGYTISYDIEELNRNNDFIKQLDPNNPMYTQSGKKMNLTPEELAKRKAIVERLITNYRKMEHDEWYENRKEKEDDDMYRVANLVNSGGLIHSIGGMRYYLES